MDTMNHPSRGGLYDSALGPLDKKSLCTTCSLGHDICPGHMGHIDLAMPVYNPVLFSSLYRIIRSLCPQCYQLRVPKHQTHKVIAVLKLIDHGLLIDAAELEATNFALKKPKKAAKGKKGALAAADKRKQKKGKASFTTEEAGEGMEEDEEEEEDDDDDENVPEEPMIDTGADGEEEPEIDAEALMASIDAFVKDAIHRAKDTPRGNNRPVFPLCSVEDDADSSSSFPDGQRSRVPPPGRGQLFPLDPRQALPKLPDVCSQHPQRRHVQAL